MGLIIDTNVFVKVEREKNKLDFNRFAEHGDVFISAITVSELLVGVHRANSPERKNRRKAFVESILQRFPALPFNVETARVHAELFAQLSDVGNRIGAHDLIIAATGISLNFAVVTGNYSEFERVPGLTVISV
mgnify:CR=1 FL=1